MLAKDAAKKKPEERDAVETALLQEVTAGCDWTEKSYLAPILETIRDWKD
jgi:hypothetical protein